MSKAPIMPVFPDALIADTTHLSTEEFGAYCLILMATWRNDGQPFADEDRRLARVCRVSERRWRNRLRPALAGFFDLTALTWRQKRLEKEWEFAQKNVSQKSIAGKASALKKKNTATTAVSEPLSQPIPISIPIKEEVDASHLPRASKGEPAGFAEWYAGYPHKVARREAASAYASALARASPETLATGRDSYIANKPPDISWKYPATWLNKDCWLDEPAINGGKVNGQGKLSSTDTLIRAFGLEAGLGQADSESYRPAPAPLLGRRDV